MCGRKAAGEKSGYLGEELIESGLEKEWAHYMSGSSCRMKELLQSSVEDVSFFKNRNNFYDSSFINFTLSSIKRDIFCSNCH